MVKPEERPSVDEPRKRLPTTVGATLKQALEKRLKEMKVTEESSGKKIIFDKNL